MPSPLLNTPEAWDVAIEATLQIRRDRLQRVIRGQRLRVRIVSGLVACIALVAVTALIYGDFEAAVVVALMACMVFSFACIASRVGRKKAAELMLEMERSAKQ